MITDKADLYGIETRFTLFDQRIMANLEYTDTQVACNGDSPTLNCYYEHGTYKSGYRHYHRTIGSTYDNDAQTLVATFLIQTKAGNSWQLKFRKIDLNTDNIDRYPDDIYMGNTVSQVAEDILQFDGQYKFIALDSRFTLGMIVTNSKFANNTGYRINEDPNNEDGTEAGVVSVDGFQHHEKVHHWVLVAEEGRQEGHRTADQLAGQGKLSPEFSKSTDVVRRD